MSAAPHKKEALGKGIRSLLQHIDADLKSTAAAMPAEEKVIAATTIERIPLDQIEVNPMQPRRDFDEKALEELAQSIRIHDVIQPITVTRIQHKKFRLIAGERRLRAARIAGLKDIPAYIRQADDRQLLELALTENLQREDLNAIETALSYRRLMEECELTQEQVAERIGKDRTTVTNYLRLLKLPPDIQVAVRNGRSAWDMPGPSSMSKMQNNSCLCSTKSSVNNFPSDKPRNWYASWAAGIKANLLLKTSSRRPINVFRTSSPTCFPPG